MRGRGIGTGGLLLIYQADLEVVKGGAIKLLFQFMKLAAALFSIVLSHSGGGLWMN